MLDFYTCTGIRLHDEKHIELKKGVYFATQNEICQLTKVKTTNMFSKQLTLWERLTLYHNSIFGRKTVYPLTLENGQDT